VCMTALPEGRDELTRCGTWDSVHSFRWVLPYVIRMQHDVKRRPLKVLEYGPGCNTEQFMKARCLDCLVSVEDNATWYEKFRGQVSTNEGVMVDYHLVEVTSAEGKAYHGGHCWTEEEILTYVNYPRKYGDAFFDIIFVDSSDHAEARTVDRRSYSGWPIRNLCLELSHTLLSDKGVVVTHDVPGPFHAMNRALQDNLCKFQNSVQFEEFYTTVLSDTLDLAALRLAVSSRYRLGFCTRALTRFLNRRGTSWCKHPLAVRFMKSAMRLDGEPG